MFFTQTSRKQVLILFSLLVLLVSSSALVQAQKVITKTFGRAGGVFHIIEEIGALLMELEDGIKVEDLMSETISLEKYKAVDIKKGDYIKMFNGKRVKDIAAFKEIFDSLTPGDEVKLGVKRGKQMLIVSFPKALEGELPKRKMMVMGGDDMSSPAAMALIGVGVIVKEENNKFLVDQVISEMSANFTKNPPQVGDEIVKILGQSIDSGTRFASLVSDVKSGETVSMILLRNGKEIISEFVKPEPDRGGIKMIKKTTIGHE